MASRPRSPDAPRYAPPSPRPAPPAEEAEQTEDRRPRALSPPASHHLPRSPDALTSLSPRPAPPAEEAERAEDRRPHALSPTPEHPRPRLAPPAEGEEWAEHPPRALSQQPGLPQPSPFSSSHQKLGDNYSTLEAYVAAHKMKSGEYPNAYTHTICEKVIAACEEKNLTNSSDPSILTPILDDVYNGHHGGYERGRGLGWSRGVWRHNMSSEASNENVRQLTTELQHTQSELQNAMKEIDNIHAREREMEARQQEHMEAMLARERELEMRQQKQEEAMEVREREMLSQIQQMKDMLSMFVSSDSVGDRRSRARTSRSQPPLP
ncbi:hypothetical protein Taro_020480 [Colocasia esculenta]|uniref:Uncharacterized protein n=1 Tax=Colocasia esculenta TaxID=4460 RepID=A0A843UWG4_COLES|nr:hypothetical protein [Colocasia esculenta]